MANGALNLADAHILVNGAQKYDFVAHKPSSATHITHSSAHILSNASHKTLY